MSIECRECEQDARAGHGPECSRRPWDVFIWRADGKRLHREWFGAYVGPLPTIGRTIQLRWLDERDGVNTPTGEPFRRERIVRVKPRARQLHVMAPSTGRARYSSMWVRIWRASAKKIVGPSK